jgi:hypothetical protein
VWYLLTYDQDGERRILYSSWKKYFQVQRWSSEVEVRGGQGWISFKGKRPIQTNYVNGEQF